MRSADTFENAFELVHAVVRDDKLALTAATVPDADFRREFFAQLALKNGDIGILRDGFFCRLRLRLGTLRVASRGFQFADGPLVLDRFKREAEREFRIER